MKLEKNNTIYQQLFKMMFFVLCSVICVCFGGDKEDVRQLADVHTKFGFDLLEKIHGGVSGAGNLLLSPYSITSALTLAYLGADGKTFSELQEKLGYPETDSLEIYKNLFNYLPDEVSITNRICAKAGKSVKESFRDEAQKYLDSPSKQVDSANDPDSCHRAINEWIKLHTEGKIKDFLHEDSVSPDTALLLVNAIYFKAIWKDVFNKKDNIDADFYIKRSVQQKVTYMSIEGRVGNYPNARLIELPFKGDDVSMFILLPDESKDLYSLQKQLQLRPDLLHTAIRNLQKKATVKIPKIELRFQSDLTNPLIQVGMGDMFTSTANFSQMTDSPMHVDKVVHKVSILVQNDGINAVVTTIESMTNILYELSVPRQARNFIEDRKSRGTEPRDFVVHRKLLSTSESEFLVDRPFLFLIREKTTESVLLMGQIETPSDAGRENSAQPIYSTHCILFSTFLTIITGVFQRISLY